MESLRRDLDPVSLGDPDRPVADAGHDVNSPAECLDVPADGVHLGYLAMLDLRDAGLRDAHHGGDLRLGEAGVLAQLRELVAALLGPERGTAALALSNSLRGVPARIQLTGLPLGVLPADRLPLASSSASRR